MKSLNNISEVNELVTDGAVHVVLGIADFCGPCKRMRPLLEELDYDSLGFDLHMIDVQDNPTYIREFNRSGIPAFIVYKDGEYVGSFQGASDGAGFVERVNKVLDDA